MSSPPVAGIFPVTAYGAKCDGVKNDTAAIRAAIQAASESAGNEVKFPVGTCAISDNVPISGPKSISIAGAGSTATFIVQHGAANIFEITSDNVTVEDLNLNTAEYNPGPTTPGNPKPGVIFSTGNNTTVRNVTGEAGSGFGMRFTGPNPCYDFTVGGASISNVDMTTTGVGGFAAVDIDCQTHAIATNITIHGGILAIFNDEFVTLNGETFTPGPNGITCEPPWFITGPAHDITVENVLSQGGHGVIHNPTSNITVTNQTVLGPGC